MTPRHTPQILSTCDLAQLEHLLREQVVVWRIRYLSFFFQTWRDSIRDLESTQIPSLFKNTTKKSDWAASRPHSLKCHSTIGPTRTTACCSGAASIDGTWRCMQPLNQFRCGAGRGEATRQGTVNECSLLFLAAHLESPSLLLSRRKYL
jgi:hypothetical protein